MVQDRLRRKPPVARRPWDTYDPGAPWGGPDSGMGPLSRRLAGIGLGPLLYLQGRAARRRIPILPEPLGAREGVSGAGRPLKLLVTGDSAAAGVGVAHQHEALLGHLVAGVAAECRVGWVLLAKTGATTAGTLRAVEDLGPTTFDVAVVSVGLNDVLSGVRCTEWQGRHAALRGTLKQRFAARHVVVCGLPPIGRFVVLPQPLRWYLGSRVGQFDRALRRDVERELGSSFLGFDFSEDVAQMAVDGFHPGPRLYAAWGARLAALILADLRAESGPG